KSHSDGVARNERANAAGRELKALRTQIASACPGDPTIGLAAGADALRAFVAEMGDIADVFAPSDDIDVLYLNPRRLPRERVRSPAPKSPADERCDPAGERCPFVKQSYFPRFLRHSTPPAKSLLHNDNSLP
ncbi:MAG: hypothetical protein Q8Q62_09500, partial [Mesorhizobium sp.]|nr:hypothetical protein [Mesorhizobium sp.]